MFRNLTVRNTLWPKKTCDYITTTLTISECTITHYYCNCNRTLIVKVILYNVVTFWGHSV